MLYGVEAGVARISLGIFLIAPMMQKRRAKTIAAAPIISL